MILQQLVIITGMSGAGKTHAARCFEDMGFLCADNLPPQLIRVFTDLVLRTRGEIDRVALVVDIREGRFLNDLPEVITALRRAGQPVRILFLEATEETLLRRFSETRRPHPLQHEGALEDAIRRERRVLAPIRALAEPILDTSGLTVHEMREVLNDLFTPGDRSERLRVSVMSFGYKYGVPQQADIVLDVRFLPNPFFEEELRPKSGREAEVRAFLEAQADYGAFLRRVESLLDFLLPRYVSEGKSYLTFALGCTGGRHRSVAAAEALTRYLERQGYKVRTQHRDVDKDSR